MAWPQPQGGQPPNQFHGPPQPTPQRRNTNPPPSCFRCGGPHFVVACPQQQSNTGFGGAPVPTPTPPYQQYPAPVPAVQPFQPRPGPMQAQYPPYQQPPSYPVVGQPPYYQPPVPYSGPAPVNPHHPLARPGQYVPYNQGPPPSGPPQHGTQPYQAPYVAPQPYRPPVPPYQAPQTPYQPQNNGYQAPPPHWNSQNSQPFQRPLQRSASFASSRRDYSAPLNQHSQNQQNGPTQQMAPEPFQPPHTGLPGSVQHHSNAPASSLKILDASGVSTPASTSTLQPSPMDLATSEASKGATNLAKIGSSGREEPFEEGEVTAIDDDEEQWEWEMAAIFRDPLVKEEAQLAQTLASYDSTPVPRIGTWNTNAPSVSRYARKENVKEFCRSVRDSHQWRNVQEDPAFCDLNQEAPLIPLDEISAWVTARRAKADVDFVHANAGAEVPGQSRKRARSDDLNGDDAEQEDVDNQIQTEAASTSQVDRPRSKRQKNEAEQEDDVMQTEAGSRTPVLAGGRDGTPYLPTDTNDATWAPEPGERASSPTRSPPSDPTEALLASLGVTGSPKPVEEDVYVPYPGPTGSQSPIQESSLSRRASQSRPVSRSHSSQTPSGSRRGSMHAFNTSQPPPPPPQTGRPNSVSQSHNFTPDKAMHVENGASTGSGPYPPNRMSQAFNGNAQYTSPHTNNSSAGPAPNTQFRPPQGPPQQYGPPMQQPYIQGPQSYFPQPPNQGYNQGPPRNHHQPPAQQYDQGTPNNYPLHNQYGYGNSNPHPTNAPPYGPPRSQSFGSASSPQHPFPPQAGPGQYGPQNQPSVNQYQPQQQYPGPHSQFQHSQYNSAPYMNGPTVQGPRHDGNMPPRQDSGYVSARGSWSNSSGSSGFNRQPNNSFNQGQPSGYNDQNGNFQSHMAHDGLPTPTENQGCRNDQNGHLRQTSGNHGLPQNQQSPINQRPAPQQSFQGQHQSHDQSSFGGQTGQNSQNPSQQAGSGGQNEGQSQPGFHNRNGIQEQHQNRGFAEYGHNGAQPAQPSPNDGAQQQFPPIDQENQASEKFSRSKSLDHHSAESPLSPTSAELLGMLEGNKSGQVKIENPKRKQEARRKQAQPVVAEAYSRRW